MNRNIFDHDDAAEAAPQNYRFVTWIIGSFYMFKMLGDDL